MPRKITNKVLELAEAGMLSWESLARAALGYMSEDEVHHLAESEGFIEWYDEEDED
jgi:hypothetical protein